VINDKKEILEEIRQIQDTLVRLTAAVEQLVSKSNKTQRPDRKRSEKIPLSEDEAKTLQERFQALYNRWLSGEENSTQADLEKMEVEQIRRFADANNLDVTSNMSKQKILHLVASRFREKRQLTLPSNIPSDER